MITLFVPERLRKLHWQSTFQFKSGCTSITFQQPWGVSFSIVSFQGKENQDTKEMWPTVTQQQAHSQADTSSRSLPSPPSEADPPRGPSHELTGLFPNFSSDVLISTKACMATISRMYSPLAPSIFGLGNEPGSVNYTSRHPKKRGVPRNIIRAVR